MKRRRALILTGLLALGAAGCTTTGPVQTPVGNVVPPGYNPVEYKSAADVPRTDLSYIPPFDPRYAENGAPRAGEPTGYYVAGDPRFVGDGMSYSPIQHRYRRP
jgi:hypothetical protein